MKREYLLVWLLALVAMLGVSGCADSSRTGATSDPRSYWKLWLKSEPTLTVGSRRYPPPLVNTAEELRSMPESAFSAEFTVTNANAIRQIVSILQNADWEWYDIGTHPAGLMQPTHALVFACASGKEAVLHLYVDIDEEFPELGVPGTFVRWEEQQCLSRGTLMAIISILSDYQPGLTGKGVVTLE